MKLLITILLLLSLTGCLTSADMGAMLQGFSQGVAQSPYGSIGRGYSQPRTCSTLNGLTHCW